MDKKIIGIILLLFFILAITVGTYHILTPQYKQFSDSDIQVEIPSDINITVNDTGDEYIKNTLYSTDYSNFNKTHLSIFDIINNIINPKNEIIMPFTGINIISINPNNTDSEEMYTLAKKTYTEDGIGDYKIINGSDYNYNGTIHNITDQKGINLGYSIVIFDNKNMKIITLLSTDLNTVIHMAKTIKIK
jgi:hypothetical protein